MHERILIGGVDDPASVPSNYKRLQRRHVDTLPEPMAFLDVVEYLTRNYGIEWRDLYYSESDSPGDAHPVNHYRALVNPAWEGKPAEEIPGDRTDAVWHIPTKKYTKADPSDLWQPLHSAFVEEELSSEVFGTARVRREGGEIHMDLFTQFGLEEEGEELTFGIATGHDYYGNTRLYVDTIAYHDPGDGVGQVMRYLTDPKRRKHTGEASDDVVEWYGESLQQLEHISSTIYGVVTDAMHYEVPLKDLPCSIPGFYEHLGLPNRGDSELADPAGDRAVETAVGPYTAWHLYKAGMWAIEHEYDSRDTSSFKKHVNAVNTLLFNPSLAEKRVLESIEEDIETDADQSEVWDFVDEDASATLETVRSRAKTISEGVEEFESTRERIKTMLEDDGVVESDPETTDT